MDALFLFGQAVVVSALAYGGYLVITNWDLSDKESIEREFHAGSGLQPPAERYEPREDLRVAGETDLLL